MQIPERVKNAVKVEMAHRTFLTEACEQMTYLYAKPLVMSALEEGCREAYWDEKIAYEDKPRNVGDFVAVMSDAKILEYAKKAVDSATAVVCSSDLAKFAQAHLDLADRDGEQPIEEGGFFKSLLKYLATPQGTIAGLFALCALAILVGIMSPEELVTIVDVIRGSAE